MYTNKEIFWAALVYYAISIYSIYNFIMLYIEGDLAYFITFIVIFAIDKIVTLIIALDQKSYLPFWIFDIFQVGFVYIFFTQFIFDIKASILTKTLARVFPQIVIEFIFFFCLGIARNNYNNITENTQIATFINFFLFILLLIILICIADAEKQNWKQILRYIFDHTIKISGYYLSLCSLTYLNDPLGINLGYYQFIIFLISAIALFAKQIIRNNEYSRLLGIAITYIFLNSDWGQDKRTINKFTQSMAYISQLARVILIVVFCDLKELFQQQTQSSDKLKQICILSTLLFSGIYFLIYFKSILQNIISTKIIFVQHESSLKKATKILKYKHLFTTKFEIYIGYIPPGTYSELLAQQNFSHQMLEFWKGVSEQIKHSKKVKLQTKYDIWSGYFFEEHLDQVENIPLEILSLFFNRIDQQQLIQRFDDGLICNQTSLEMISYYENTRPNIKSYSYLVSQILSLNLFLKDFSQYISIMPAQILYDLHE